MSYVNSANKRIETLQSQLKKGRLVILLLHGIAACLDDENVKSGGWHYVVAVGFNDVTQKIDIISGWRDMSKSSSTSSAVHKRLSADSSDNAHVECTYAEMEKANPAFFWVQQKVFFLPVCAK